MLTIDLIKSAVHQNVSAALAEDIGDGDITAMLIPEDQQSVARVITRDRMVLAGKPWVDYLFNQCDQELKVTWLAEEGQWVDAGTPFLQLEGCARSLLTAERTALNFIQTLSATATKVRLLTFLLEGTGTKLLDTRKTLPGLRIAQKYAVGVGGGHNHRLGLFDAFLIKENHIMAAGGITAAVNKARVVAPGKPVEVEVETMSELDEAIACRSDIIMLDNFTLSEMSTAVERTQQRAKLEASGNITVANLRQVAETGVDYISMGSLTKDVTAIDLSMRIIS